MRYVRWALMLIVLLALPPASVAARQDRSGQAGQAAVRAGEVGGQAHPESDAAVGDDAMGDAAVGDDAVGDAGDLVAQTQPLFDPAPLPDLAPLPPAADPPAPAAAGRRVVGYYVPYDQTSWESFEARPRAVDVLAAQWVAIDACGQISTRDNQTVNRLARARGVAVYPSLLTSSGWLNHRVLTDEAATARAIGQIVEYVVAEGYEGFDLDLEGVQADDRAAYTAFVARLGAALRERGKALAIAVPPKPRDVTTGWAGAFDYAALGEHADLIIIMAYEYSGSWSGPGSVAPYDSVDQVLQFATAQMPADKIVLGLAFYGYDWNTTSGGSRGLSYAQAAALAEHHGVPIATDPATRSATFRYRAAAGDRPPSRGESAPVQHEITRREPPPCQVAVPSPPPTPTPRPTPPPDAIQEHEVWLEDSAGSAARLGLADRYRLGGVAAWRLGLEDPRVWPILDQWRGSEGGGRR